MFKPPETDSSTWKWIDLLAKITIPIALMLVGYVVSYMGTLEADHIRFEDRLDEIDNYHTEVRVTEFTARDAQRMKDLILEELIPRLDNYEKCLIRISNNGSCDEFR